MEAEEAGIDQCFLEEFCLRELPKRNALGALVYRAESSANHELMGREIVETQELEGRLKRSWKQQ